MGKGYNNYMCKKPFHPGSKANIKRAWMAEQKTENDKRKQEELKVQYEKEQDLYTNRSLISTESKDKLELNFMYEAPPGVKREHQKEDDEPEYKFEWQRKYNAPREDYAKGNEDIKDQPFGIAVRNVRCIKCHKWGHINTDKECPLFSQASTSSMPTTSMDPLDLMRQMKEEGYGLKESVLGHHINPLAANQQLIQTDESDPEAEFLKSLSTADKKKLLRKLKKLSKKHEKHSKSKKKKSKKSHKSKGNESSGSDSEDDKKKKKRKESSSSDDESTGDEKNTIKKKRKQHSSSKEEKHKMQWSSSSEDEAFTKTPNIENKKRQHKTHESSGSNLPKSSGQKESSTKHKYKTDYKSVQIKKEQDSNEKSDSKPRNPTTSSEEETSSKKKKTPKRSSCDVSNAKKIKTESTDLKSDREKSLLRYESDSNLEHPDGFSHSRPQSVKEINYKTSEHKYAGSIHDKFRFYHRDERSPSVKHKYYY